MLFVTYRTTRHTRRVFGQGILLCKMMNFVRPVMVIIRIEIIIVQLVLLV